MEATEASLDADEERFQKNLLADQNTFQDRLDSLNMAVAGFAAHTDISKAHEVANEVRRLTKQLKECQALANTYNNRERLFGLPVTSVSCSIRLYTCTAICVLITKTVKSNSFGGFIPEVIQ